MKKLIALVAAAVILVSAVGCIQINVSPASSGETETQTDVNEVIDEILGGWNRAESPVITDEIREMLEKAAQEKLGAKYTPAAYIGYQIVNGTNHAILCRIAPVVPDAKEHYAIVYIYEDLAGNVSITDVKDFEAETNLTEEPVVGGWTQPETPEMTEEAQAAFDKAMEKLLGANYVPVALAESQVVAGMNYCILCESTVVYPGAETSYALVYIYEDLDGNAEITEIVSLTQEQ